MYLQLTSQEALSLTANFAIAADRLRTADESFEIRASICETASRVAFLRAHRIARREEVFPAFGETFRRASFASA
jgi:hypothetical protein